MHSFTNDDKQYTALTNAYRRLATRSDTKSVPVCCDYGKYSLHVMCLIDKLRIGYGLIGMGEENA